LQWKKTAEVRDIRAEWRGFSTAGGLEPRTRNPANKLDPCSILATLEIGAQSAPICWLTSTKGRDLHLGCEGTARHRAVALNS